MAAQGKDEVMVGGIVKEVLWKVNKIWVNCSDPNHPDAHNDCAIYVARNATSERIKPGDHLWWQGRQAMWTPQENCGPECGHREHVTCTPGAGWITTLSFPGWGTRA